MSAVTIPFDADIQILKWEESCTKSTVCEERKKAKKEKKGDWIVEGYAATDHIDSEDDRIDAAALVDGATSLEKYTTVLFNHDKDRPIGSILEAGVLDIDEEDSGRLYIKVRISKTEPKLWEQIKDGTLNKFSVRGRILQVGEEFSDKLGRPIRVIKSLVLFECSLVSVPANLNAQTLRWYVAKALNEFLKQGGDLPADSSGGQEMTIKKDKEEEALQASEAAPSEQPAESTPEKSVEAPAETVKDEAEAPAADGAPAIEEAAPAEEAAEVVEEAPVEAPAAEEVPAEEPPKTEETAKSEFSIPFDDGFKGKIGESITHLEKLLVGASEEQKTVLEAAKSILGRAVGGYTFPDVAIPDTDLARQIIDSRLEMLKSREISEALMLISYAEKMDTDPVRRHFLSGVKMLLGKDVVAKSSEAEEDTAIQVEEEPPAEEKPGISNIGSAIEQLADHVKTLTERLEAIETAKSRSDVEVEEDNPAEEPQTEESAETAKQETDTEIDAVKELGDRLDQISKVLESMGSRIEKVEKTEGVSQSIRGQDDCVQKETGSVGTWSGIFAPGIAEAMGVRVPTE